MSDKINLKPVEKEKEPETPPSAKPIEKEKIPLPPLSKNEALYLMNEITDICSVFQASINLPETTKIDKDPAFYIEEILRALKEFNIITD